MSGNGNQGMSKLGKVLQERIKACGTSPLFLDFGSIQSDMSLLCNTYPIPIPQTDYTICRQLSLGKTQSDLTTTSNQEEHTHKVLVPDLMRQLQAGDRVLVAWVQNEAVVVDIILPAVSI